MNHKITFTVVERPILTPAEELQQVAYDILADVVYGKSPHSDALEAEAGQLFVKAAKMRLVPEQILPAIASFS
jgi:hypothetical protein